MREKFTLAGEHINKRAMVIAHLQDRLKVAQDDLAKYKTAHPEDTMEEAFGTLTELGKLNFKVENFQNDLNDILNNTRRTSVSDLRNTLDYYWGELTGQTREEKDSQN